MQEVFEEFARRVSENDEKSMHILEELLEKKKSGEIKRLAQADVNDIYDLIDSDSD